MWAGWLKIRAVTQLIENGVQLDATDEFTNRLHELLKEEGYTIDADNMGDISLTKGNRIVGYWQGVIDIEHFRKW